MEKQYDNGERIAKLEATVENIRDNHLHTIETKIDNLEHRLCRMESRMWWILLTIIASVVISNLGGMIYG